MRGRLQLDFEELGPLKLKNIDRPVEAFVLRPDAAATTPNRLSDPWCSNTSEALPLPGKPSIAVLGLHEYERRCRAGIFLRRHG